jgi:DNA-binding NarL/FixJ family response regulator
VTNYVSKYLRVYLLDDHDIVRQGLRDLLVPATDIYVVGDSASARQATRAIPELDVDVMVLDFRLQDGTGIEVCRAVRSSDPSIRGLLLTSSGDDEALIAAILAGASGYVVKLTRSSDITDAIRKVGAGRSLIDPTTMERVSQQVLREVEELQPPLTADERRLLALVLDGLTNAQVADRLGVSIEAVSSEIVTLVERILRPAPPMRGAAGTADPGRHRRTDG